MVVLLRAFTHLDAYEDSLERAGLRPYVVGGRGYWSQQQVADVCALLATIANPLDDQALFGALASPACGVAPDTLWLLRAAAGRRRHVWPALERAVGAGEAELAEPERLEQIPAAELELLRALRGDARRRCASAAPRLSLAALIEAATTETGYDLAVLMRPAGEARFANVRKLMRLAAEFEAREGRDLRGLLDFLAARAESDAEAQAATAAEGHDGVRIMTVHNAKGLEFDVVAVPDLSRSLLAGARPPLLTLGREQPPRVGMQLRRLGAASINLYDYAELCEEAQRARRRGGAAPLPRRRHPGPRAADPQRRRQAGAGPGDEAGHAGRRAPGRGARGRARRRRDASRCRRPSRARASRRASRPPRSRSASTCPRPSAPPSCARSRRDAAADRAARRGPAAAGRAPPADRPQPPPLLHRDLRLRGVRLPLLHGARARPRRPRSQLLPA